MKIIKTLKTLKTLNGRESSVLALLAMTEAFTKQDNERIFKTLSGHALKIAKVICGYKSKSKIINKAAKGFIDWAKNLK